MFIQLAKGNRTIRQHKNRGILFWTALTLLACVALLLGYIGRSSHIARSSGNISSSAARTCTLYASASGNDSSSGANPTAPITLLGAALKTQPGSVVCLLGGTYQMSNTFYPPNSGSPSAWITYEAYGDGPVNFVWTAGPIAQSMFQFGNGSFPSNPDYLEFNGLNLDGQNNALNGFLCVGAHHLRFIGNTISNTGGAGIGSVGCDYLTSDHNIINHNGYRYGWTSGISYNSNQWYDSYSGFHNIISNNVIAGEYDGSSHHTDGNGIILDLSNGTYEYSSANSPAALVINNVVYGNGGRCIEAYTVTNFWIVNNTCYMNDLDPSIQGAGSITTNNSRDGYVLNNIVVSWDSTHPSYDQQNLNANILYRADLCFGSSNNFSYFDPSQFIQADPLFAGPPRINPAAAEKYATVLVPSLLGDGLKLAPKSPALHKGIDSSLLPNLPAAIVTDLQKHIYTDINGNRRPHGTGIDLGAYQF